MFLSWHWCCWYCLKLNYIYIYMAKAEVTMNTSNILIFFWYKFIYFNLRLITLQYCVGFAIHQHESATGVHVFPILNLPHTSLPIPSPGSSQCTSPKQPVLCMEPGLAICFTYDIIHVSMPFSQIIPPSPSPTESYTHLDFKWHSLIKWTSILWRNGQF